MDIASYARSGVSYFFDLAADYKALRRLQATPTPANANEQQVREHQISMRTALIWERVLGGLLAFASVAGTFQMIGLIVAYPTLATLGLALSLFCLIIAHDLIRLGYNLREVVDLNERSFLSQVWTIGQIVAREARGDVPHAFRNTIFFQAVWRFTQEELRREAVAGGNR